MENSQIIIKPLVTEKSTVLRESGVYSFVVHPDSNKISIKQAIKALFNVEVDSVRIIRKKPQKVALRSRRGFGQKSGFKKALVKLKGDAKINELEV